MVSIVDTGTGMSKAVVDRAFEPFFTTKPVGRGTGLGLSMVYGFVKQSGGHLSIDSEPGRGTKVTLFLPVLTGEADAQPAEPERPAPVADTGQVVLVVEDDELMREVQVRVLGSLGYRTLEAFDGASGLAALDQAGRVDLLLTDIGLPGGMSGPALAEAARRLRPDLEVIYMSGYAPNALIKQYGLSEGQILAKPFTRSALAHAVLERLEPGRST